MADEIPTPVTPAPVTPAPAATPFLVYLKENVPNHLKAISIIAAIIIAIIGFNYVRDLQARLASQEKVTATLQQQFTKVGPAAVAGNAEQSAPQVQQQASDAFGPAIISLMAQQNAKIQSLSTSIAQIGATTTSIPTPVAPTATQQNATTGALTGYPMEEVRPSGQPPLTRLSLFYDPTQKDPTLAFKGSAWTHYQENFTTTLGTWEQQKTGGMKTTIKLTRAVMKPDPNDPTKLIQVGTEDVPITGSNTVYTPASLAAGPPPVPRWTASIGITKDATLGYQPAGTIDYRLTNRYGIFGGTVNKALVGGVSIRFGK